MVPKAGLALHWCCWHGSSQDSQCYVDTWQRILWQCGVAENNQRSEPSPLEAGFQSGKSSGGEEDGHWKVLSSSPKPQGNKFKYRWYTLAVRETTLGKSALCSKELAAWFRRETKTHMYKLNLHKNFQNRQCWQQAPWLSLFVLCWYWVLDCWGQTWLRKVILLSDHVHKQYVRIWVGQL